MPITLIMGPMFSGKTSYMIEEEKKLLNNKDSSVVVLRPPADTRQYISHKKENSFQSNIYATENFEMLPDFKTIFIEESHLFNEKEKLISWISKFKFSKKNIYITLLNGDVNQTPFPIAGNLISISNNIIFLRAKCFACKEDAAFTSLQRRKNHSPNVNMMPSLKPFIKIGGDDIYAPYCYECIKHTFFD